MAAFDGLYIDRNYLRALALIPASMYSSIPDDDLALIVRALQDLVDSYLIKRYPVPYSPARVPAAIKLQLAALVFDHLRGVIGDIPALNVDRIARAADAAHAYLRLAADSKEALAELLVYDENGAPTPDRSGVTRGGFMAITHRTPWAFQRSRRGR